MTTHFKPANTAIQEMTPWSLEAEPAQLPLRNPNAKYAVILVMAGDDDQIGGQVVPDLAEMARGIHGGDEISVVFLADIQGKGAVIQELTHEGRMELASSPSIDTGDPRPISSFLAMALKSYSSDTRIALGFWGHGSGVFNDLDPYENLIPEKLINLPLGTKITETMFLENYLAEPVPIKGFNRGMLFDESAGGVLTNRELSSALTVAFSRCGRSKPVDMIFFDTCDNGSVEVYAEMRRYCEVFVASCLNIPGLGWNYTWFLQMTRRAIPETAKAWAELAIAAYNKTYDQSLYPQPVQLAAIDSEASFLEKFKVVVGHLKQMPPEERVELMRCSNALHPVSHNESVDICSMVVALMENSKDEAFVSACGDFLESYRQDLVALSEPANNGVPYYGLSLWCPRLGDTASVGTYYQSLRFHKETGWFDAIREMVGQSPSQREESGPIFVIMNVQGAHLVEACPVEVTVLGTEEVESRHILLHIPESSKVWSGELEEGRYIYKKSGNCAFSSIDQAKMFIDFLKQLRRLPKEFAVFEAALEEDVVMDWKAARKLCHAMMKYERIVLDESPEVTESYLIVRELAQNAAKAGILLLGKL